MAFLEIEKDSNEKFTVKQLVPGEVGIGCYQGKDVIVSVAESGLLELQNGKMVYCFKGPDGSFIYDSGEKSRHGVLFLYDTEAIRFIFIEDRLNNSPDKLQQVYKSLWRRLGIDTGDPEAKRWTFGRIRDLITSAGRTEEFSDI